MRKVTQSQLNRMLQRCSTWFVFGNIVSKAVSYFEFGILVAATDKNSAWYKACKPYKNLSLATSNSVYIRDEDKL